MRRIADSSIGTDVPELLNQIGNQEHGSQQVASKRYVNGRRVLSARRRRFPQVQHDDEGGLRRETHRTPSAEIQASIDKLLAKGMVDDPQKLGWATRNRQPGAEFCFCCPRPPLATTGLGDD
jgi:hypothetical protein